MSKFTNLVRTHVLVHWRTMGGATIMSLVLTAAKAVPLVIFAAILHVLLRNLEGKPTSSVVGPGGGSEIPWGFDIGTWNNFLTARLDSSIVELGEVTFIMAAGAIYLFAVFCTTSLELAMTYVLWRLRCVIGKNMTQSLFHHICNLSLDFFNRSRTGDLVSRVTSDTYSLASETYELVNAFFVALPLAVLFWLVLFGTDFTLTLTVVGIFGVASLVNHRIARSMRRAIVASNKAAGDMVAKLNEVLAGMPIVKAFVAEPHERAAFSRIMDNNFRYYIRVGGLKRFQGSINGFVQAVAVVTVLITGVVLVVSGRMEMATFILYLAVMTKVQGPTRELIGVVSRLQTAQGYAERVFEVLEERSSVPDGSRDIHEFRDAIEFRNVSFDYDGRHAALKNLNLTIRKGEVVGVVGASGAGKSTLANLTLRFYDPREGQILIDGVDIRQLRHASYRRLFGVVTQDPILFNETVRNTIAYAATSEDVSEADVLRAAKIAHAHDFIGPWPDGYDTVIGDRGVRLSGGQRQRLTLARAILRQPQILLLDEATSSVDSEMDHVIQQAIQDSLCGRTALIVAHRISSIRNADRIIVLSEGRIIEEGSHDELLARDGAYWRLYGREETTDTPHDVV